MQRLIVRLHRYPYHHPSQMSYGFSTLQSSNSLEPGIHEALKKHLQDIASTIQTNHVNTDVKVSYEISTESTVTIRS